MQSDRWQDAGSAAAGVFRFGRCSSQQSGFLSLCRLPLGTAGRISEVIGNGVQLYISKNNERSELVVFQNKKLLYQDSKEARNCDLWDS